MHWRNSNFQYAYFILGACHTPIEAHRKCMEAIEDREVCICEVNKKHVAFEDDATGRQSEAIYKQAKDELEFLYECKNRLEKVIGRSPTPVDYQDNQREEWKLELEARAENHLLTIGTVPPDHFVTMRMHPDFPKILEKVESIKQLMVEGKQYQFLPPPWKQEVQLLENIA